MADKTCFQVNQDDNVAVLLEDADAGEKIEVIGSFDETITLIEAIEFGHKVALKKIQANEPVIKYGIQIGHATRNIQIGENVHLHNCASDYDARSASFDPKTGAAIDTQYE